MASRTPARPTLSASAAPRLKRSVSNSIMATRTSSRLATISTNVLNARPLNGSRAAAAAATTPSKQPNARARRLNIQFASSTATSSTATTTAPPPRTPTRRSPKTVATPSSSRHSTPRATERVLNGVVVMVDVRVGDDAQIDCSDVVARKLQQLGATIAKRYTPRLTHVVLSHLTPAWKEKIAKWQSGGSSIGAIGFGSSSFSSSGSMMKLHVVSQLWVNACFVNKQHMKEDGFFPVSKAPVVDTATSTPARNPTTQRATRTVAKRKIPEKGTIIAWMNAAVVEKANPQPVVSTPATLKHLVKSTPTPRASSAKKKRRALSMEPMPSDAIQKLLDSTRTTLQKQNSETAIIDRTEVAADADASKTLDLDDDSKLDSLPLSVRLKRRRTIASLPNPGQLLNIAESDTTVDSHMTSKEDISQSTHQSLITTAPIGAATAATDTKRTIKVLFALARGAWIVSDRWIFDSLEQEQWLLEEKYELQSFLPRSAREDPEARQVFKSMKFFVGANVEPSREVVISLLQCSGGEIVNQISVANMCVCGDGSLFRRANKTGIKVVTPKWVFDSIASMTLKDTNQYNLSTEAPSKNVDSELQ
ncbi:hypothetical protein PINS_up000614 [Pythium insidiosum]|nr:hypothetical protein PINS_up000614 [Pythium insidiosum]